MSDVDPEDETLASDSEPSSGLAATMAAIRSGANGAKEDAVPAAWRRYELHQELGAGGMGRVFAATDLQFGRKVAVKQLKHPDRWEGRERFELESFVTGNLEHPGIPVVYERGGDESGHPFYAMRHVQGTTLSAAIRDAKALSERLKLLPTLTRVAQTLAYAHSQGVVHRDIKPDNIIIGVHGESFVLDWGIAKVRGLANISSSGGDGSKHGSKSSAKRVDSASTQHGQVIGTPAYMAPEQAAGAVDRIDERTDVFALGAILFHILSGQEPYQGTKLHEVLAKAKEAKLPDLEKVASEAPRQLREICRKATQKNPQERYSSAGELADALEEFAVGALSRQDRGPVGHLATGVSVLSILVALLGTAMTFAAVASTSEQGLGSLSNIAFAILGVGFSVIEYRSRGRYRLSPLILGLLGATMLNGVALTFTGFVKVFAAAESPENFANMDLFREILTTGSREALSVLAASAALAMLQLFAWAVARRRILLG